MNRHVGLHVLLGAAIAVPLLVAGSALVRAQAPLAVDTARITISGTSNIHAYTASTTAVRVTRAQLAGPVEGSDIWTAALRAGGVEAFEVAIPAASLSSPREGLDKNMHKALKAEQFPEIIFRLSRIEGTPEAPIAVGKLRIAGVEREVALMLKTQRRDAALVVTGSLPLLMTDYGIKPPTALLGMLKTDPKVTVSFETVLAVPLT